MALSRKVPVVRFCGFSGEWHTSGLENFVSFFGGLTYKPEDVRNSGTLVLRSSNVKNGEIVDADNVYVVPTKADSENVRSGDIIVVVRNGSKALLGKHAEVKHAMPNTVIGAFMTGIRSTHPEFVNSLLDTVQFKQELNRNMGATINQITGYMFSQMSFNIPDEQEQDRIGRLFRKLDDSIFSQRKKCEKLLEVRQSLLERLFPRPGERTPELRFAGFSGDWEWHQLGDTISDYIEKKPKGEDLPVLTSSRQGIERQEDHFGSIQQHDISDYNVIPRGYCTYRNRSDDRTFTFNINKIADRGIVSKFYPVFKVENGDADFLTLYLNNDPRMVRQVSVRAVGTSQVVLSLTQLKEIPVLLPSSKEQEQIGKYFRVLEEYISLHQRKLTKLQHIKQALLSKMFV